MNEQPFFFGEPGRQLFGMLHEGDKSTPAHPFVFCHPFGEEKLWTHRVFVAFARELARRGHPVLRFDCSGHGDSSGDFVSSSVDTGVADTGRAIDWVCRHTGSQTVGLLGLRFGATLAALRADHDPRVRLLVLWAPIVDGARYAQELLRINLATQLAIYREIRRDREQLVEAMSSGASVNVDGYPFSHAYFEQMSRIAFPESTTFSGSCLIAQVERRENAPVSPELVRFKHRYADGSLILVQEEPFWKEIDRFYGAAPNLFAPTLAWVDGIATGAGAR